MPSPRVALVTFLALAPLGAAAAQDHARHAMADHDGMPPLRPIAAGAMHTAADVQFMQGMIAHHGQAIQMSRLAGGRSSDPRLLRFSQKIDQSQAPEIMLMGGWLADRDQVVPDSTAYRTIMMPGMPTADELAAAKQVVMAEFNPQSQPRITWPAAFPVVRSYLDQLVRGKGLSVGRTTAIGAALNASERMTGSAQAAALNALASQVDGYAASANDGERVRTMAAEIRRLAGGER